jgi:menaquinone-dependent protoporphyrinogen IX oxidase
MKKGRLKTETIRILKTVTKHLEQSTTDYNSQDLHALFSEAMAYYDLYLLKANGHRIKAEELEKMIVPKYEEGLRTRIREYLDEM